MSRLRYAQVAKDYFFDKDGIRLCKLEDIEDNAHSTVMHQLWFYGDNQDTSVTSVSGNKVYLHRSGKVSLNDCGIIVSNDAICIDVLFQDDGRTRKVSITRLLYPLFSDDTISNADYSFTAAGVNGVTHLKETIRLGSYRTNFSKLSELPKLGDDRYRSSLYVGLPPYEFAVIHKSESFSWSSYAFIIGTVAVLLKHDFTFDSIATLTGCSSGQLNIGTFLYSVNPRIVKLMLMG